MAKTTYDPKTKRMITAEAAKAEGGDGQVRISLSKNLADQLIECAKEDGIDLSGTSFVYEADGKTKKMDKDGEPVKKNVAVSKVRVTNTVRQYTEIAVQEWLTARNNAS